MGLFVTHCLSGGIALAATPQPSRKHRAAVSASEPAKARPAIELAAASPGPDPKVPSALEEVTINAQRTSDALARLAQKQAPNIIDIETYSTIKQLPDVTTAEAVERIPGISRETDEGEARYINIRGLDADLNSTTFDGVRLMPTNNASPFGGYRAVTLDSIPIGLVGAIEVTKSNLPSQDAEALGGTINISPKTAPPSGKPFLEGRVGGGYEPLRGTPIIDLQVSGGGRFGGQGTPGGGVSAYSDAPFSVVATLAYYEDKRGIDDAEPAYIDAATRPDPLYSAINNLQQRDYELNRKRFGWGLDLGYQPDADDKYYVRGFQAGYNERYWREFFNLTPDGNPAVSGTGQIVDSLNNPGAIQMGFRDEREINKEALYMAGGENIFGGGQTLDYRLAFTKGTWHKPYDYDSAFNYAMPANAAIAYGPTGEGHTPLYAITGAPGYLDPANYQLS
ncbi:MAG: TonB-dependent receptor plug domain-containing protein, partial [Acetobacteraceae bacterium]